VQRVIEPGNAVRSIPKCRMRRHVGNSLAVDPDLATVTQALEILGPGKRTTFDDDRVLGFHNMMFLLQCTRTNG
jgi:hypothetical protein